MAAEGSHEHANALLGAYALRALDENERRDVEAHLGACEPCRAQAEPLEEVVHGLAAERDRLRRLWERIASGCVAEPRRAN